MVPVHATNMKLRYSWQHFCKQILHESHHVLRMKRLHLLPMLLLSWNMSRQLTFHLKQRMMIFFLYKILSHIMLILIKSTKNRFTLYLHISWQLQKLPIIQINSLKTVSKILIVSWGRISSSSSFLALVSHTLLIMLKALFSYDLQLLHLISHIKTLLQLRRKFCLVLVKKNKVQVQVKVQRTFNSVYR